MVTAADALALTALVALNVALAAEARLAELADDATEETAVDAAEDAAVDVTVDTVKDAAEDAAEDAEADTVDAVVEEAEAPADNAAELEALEVAIDDDIEVEDAPEFKAELCNMPDEVLNALDELCNRLEELCVILVDDSTKWTVSTVFCVPCDMTSPPPKLSSLDLRTAENRFLEITVAPANAIPTIE